MAEYVGDEFIKQANEHERSMAQEKARERARHTANACPDVQYAYSGLSPTARLDVTRAAWVDAHGVGHRRNDTGDAMKFTIATRSDDPTDEFPETVVDADYASIDSHGSLVLLNAAPGGEDEIVAVFHSSHWVTCIKQAVVATPLKREAVYA